MEAAGLGLMTYGGWMGGTLVYRNQIGVDHRYARAGKWKEATVTGTLAGADNPTVNWAVVVPLLPSLIVTSPMVSAGCAPPLNVTSCSTGVSDGDDVLNVAWY